MRTLITEGPEQALEPNPKSHLDYRAVFDLAPDGIVVVDGRGVIVEVNPRAQELFGYELSELLGQPIEVLVPEEYREQHATVRSGFSQKETIRPMGVGHVLSGRRKDQSVFPVEVSLSPGRAGDDRLVIAVVRDVTERLQLRAFGQGAVRAAEEERQRISRELHDDTAQLLAALLLRVRIAAKTHTGVGYREVLDGIRKGLHEASDSVRRIARGLRPPALEEVGVVNAIQAYIRSLFDNQDIRLSFHAGAVEKLLDAERKLVLYRVVQEALSNVVRHSGATCVNVEIEVAGAWVVAVVVDDGAGFDETRVGDGGGLGLVGMRERAVGVGGSVIVNSGVGKGTHVKLAIPLQEQVIAYG